MFLDAIISAMVGALVGVIAFVVIKTYVTAQDTTGWTASDTAIIGIIPTGIGILVLVGIFTSLTVRRSAN